MEKSCWWYEGGRCYAEPCRRDSSGRSLKTCAGKCTNYKGKRAVLEKFIPSKYLIIASEYSK